MTDEQKLRLRLSEKMKERGWYAVIYGYIKPDGSHHIYTNLPVITRPEHLDRKLAAMKKKYPLVIYNHNYEKGE